MVRGHGNRLGNEFKRYLYGRGDCIQWTLRYKEGKKNGQKRHLKIFLEVTGHHDRNSQKIIRFSIQKTMCLGLNRKNLRCYEKLRQNFAMCSWIAQFWNSGKED